MFKGSLGVHQKNSSSELLFEVVKYTLVLNFEGFAKDALIY